MVIPVVVTQLHNTFALISLPLLLLSKRNTGAKIGKEEKWELALSDCFLINDSPIKSVFYFDTIYPKSNDIQTQQTNNVETAFNRR